MKVANFFGVLICLILTVATLFPLVYIFAPHYFGVLGATIAYYYTGQQLPDEVIRRFVSAAWANLFILAFSLSFLSLFLYMLFDKNEEKAKQRVTRKEMKKTLRELKKNQRVITERLHSLGI